MMPINNKSYFVTIDRDLIYISKFNNLTMCATIGEPLHIEGYITETAAHSLYKDMAEVTEEDIVKLFEKE